LRANDDLANGHPLRLKVGKHDDTRDVIGRKRLARIKQWLDIGIVAGKRSIHYPRLDARHPDTCILELEPQRMGKAHETPFRRYVYRLADVTFAPRGR